MEDIEENQSFEERISTILFIAALEDAKDPITAQILKRQNEQQTKAAEDRALRDKVQINSAKSTKEHLTLTALNCCSKRLETRGAR